MMSSSCNTHIHIAIPAMQEELYLKDTLKSIEQQTYKNFTVWICINQADDWWLKDDKIHVCINNQNTLDYINKINSTGSNIKVIDKSSKGKGWLGKQGGVGHARKILMDLIINNSDEKDIIISMDADTTFGKEYFQSIADIFSNNKKAVAIANPYYHELSGIDSIDRSMLRYEIYMRSYTINLLRIESPYAFAAFGSAIAFPVWAYKKINGITPKQSGEDFYLLQKLRKTGKIILSNDQVVSPATRVSDRVPFGTGPAIAKTVEEQQHSYPIFNPEYFDEIYATYLKFEELFHRDVKTSMSDFLHIIFNNEDIFTPLRNNYKTVSQFVNACHNKIDGLRIFQYLKWRSLNNKQNDVENLRKLFEKTGGNNTNVNLQTFNFLHSTINDINIIRNQLFQIESRLRKQLK
ncbi:MAG: glycosyltransferase [Bacteroidota bacterium]